MMRKSSLGRRSSTNIPTRIPSLGGSNQRKCSAEKRASSVVRQTQTGPHSQPRRSQSVDRESCGAMNRVSTYGRSLVTMTPKTPAQKINVNLPTGSARPSRTSSVSTDSNRRLSSFGGTKNTRKDSRPINEKAFQQAAQAKIQQYLDQYGGPDFANIKPMSTALFVNLMDHFLKYFDTRTILTKTNYVEEVPILLRKYGYRSKIDRSWLLTVNTPHAWQHVLALLSWLVDVVQCIERNDEFEIMYTNITSEPDEDEDDKNEVHLKIDGDVVNLLKKTFKCSNRTPTVEELENEFIRKLIVDNKCTDEELEKLEREIELIQVEVAHEEVRRDQESEPLEVLKKKKTLLQNNFDKGLAYKEQTNEFIKSTEERISALKKEIEIKRVALEKRQYELQVLQEKVKYQKISMDDKKKLTKEKHDLLRAIQFSEATIREYENSAFAIDLNLAENQRKVEKLILDQNKVVAEKISIEPRFKDIEVKCILFNKAEKESMDLITVKLLEMKEEYKSSLHMLKVQEDEATSELLKIKQEIVDTKEEIAKETTILEGLECELEKQEEIVNKESLELKEEANRYQKLANEIEEELSQFEIAKLENKKIELNKLENTWNFIQVRSKLLLEERQHMFEEAVESIKGPITKRNKDFQKKLLEK